MAANFSRLTNLITTARSNRDEVYIAAVPLRAPKGAGQLFVSSLYSLNFFDFQHFMVILKLDPSSSSSSPRHSQALVYDFQPQDPEDLFTAVAALTGRKIPWIVLTRKIKSLPRRKCWFAGYSNLECSVNGAKEFNEEWDTDLRIGYNDCRNYVDGLVEYLTGEVLALDKLRKGRN